MRKDYVKAATARIVAVAAFFAVCVALCGVAPAWAAGASATATALPTPALARHAPPGVPQGYVVTPFGYFHPSCVHAVGHGEVLLGDGRIKRTDGTTSAMQVCRYARYTKNGTRIALGDSPPGPVSPRRGLAYRTPEADGWLEASWYHQRAPFGGISARWLVPSAPASNVGQVLYYFPGLEDYENVVSILQPVLAWNGFNDQAWTIASWNCCTSGNANYSTPESAASGDAIVGTVSGDCAAGRICSTWNVATVDKSNGQATTLEQTSSYGQTFDWAFAGVVEVYGVQACDQYSNNGFVDFTSVSLLDVEKKSIRRVPWTPSGLMQDAAPACNYGVTVTPTSASLSF